MREIDRNFSEAFQCARVGKLYVCHRAWPFSCNASFKSSYGLTNGVHIKGGNVRKLFLNLLRQLNYLRSAVDRPPP